MLKIGKKVCSSSHKNLFNYLKLSEQRCCQRNICSGTSCRHFENIQLQLKNLPKFRCNYSNTIIRQISVCNSLYDGNQSVTSKLMNLSTSVDKIAYELNTEIKNKSRIYKSDFMRLLNKIYEMKFASTKHVSLILNCCTNLMPEASPEERIIILNTAWNNIRSFYDFTINDYNEILICYKANKHKFRTNEFLKLMSPILPNSQTYYNLLAAVCEVGDVNQAQEILANMKVAKIPITEECFNNLIEGYGHARDISGAKNILDMMKSMRIEPSSETDLSFLKASICSESISDLETCLSNIKRKNANVSEKQGMEIIKCLANTNLNKYISKVLALFPEDTWQGAIINPTINAACIQLIYEGHPEIAYDIYRKFPKPEYNVNDDQNLYFRKLLRECVKAQTPWVVIKHICSDLANTELNVFSYHVACEAALQTANISLATSLLTEMKEKGFPIRPHYFWSMFSHSAKTVGEKGVFDILSLMTSLQVNPDFDTIIEYILPYINTESLQMVIRKFQACGLNVSTTLSPVLYFALKANKLRDASELCEIHPTKIDCQSLCFSLVHAFHTVGDFDSLFIILDRFADQSISDAKDWIGLFLVTFLTSRRHTTDFEKLVTILEHFMNKKNYISSVSADLCKTLVANSKLDSPNKEKAADILGSIVNNQKIQGEDLFEQYIQHPKDMSLRQMEAHLIELESKKMNTRGILRKLLQEYCRFGMAKEAKIIVKKCETSKVNFSAGMLASVVDMYVKCNDLENAERYFYEIQKTAPNFQLDEFKLLDYATLLVSNGKMAEALKLVQNYGEKVRVYGGPKIESNCWRLIDAVAKLKNPKDTEDFFAVMCNLGFCQPSNILLGPLMRCHLQSSDLLAAVEQFKRISTTYRKTPLKHELLCRLLKLSSGTAPDSKEMIGDVTKQEASKKYVSLVLECDKHIHGNQAAQISLVVALADCGLKKQLRKYALDPSVTINDQHLIKQCQRLGEESKTSALEVIAECLNGIRNINIEKIYEIIINVYSLNGDCESALTTWTKMHEINVKPTQKFISVFSGLLRSHKYELPPDLIGHLDVKTKEQVLDI